MSVMPCQPEWTRWEMSRTTLEQHVKECELRYQQIDSRLATLEHKVDKIIDQIDSFKTFFVQLAISGLIGLLLMIATAVFVIKM